MQVEMNVPILSLNGKPIETGEALCESCHRPIDATALTLRSVLINSLMGEDQSDRNIDGAIKYKRFKLARRIDDHDQVNLSAEEIAQLKERVAKFYTALVVGQVWDLLDPPPAAEADNIGIQGHPGTD